MQAIPEPDTIAEPSPAPSAGDGDSFPASRPGELGYRVRQQALLGEFGRWALQARDLGEMLQRATELCAAGLGAGFGKILEYEAHEDRLLVRAGIGWEPGVVGVATFDADLGSPAGFAYRTGRSVLSNDLGREAEFEIPDLLARHGIRRAINVIIDRGGEERRPFGVLEVDSADHGAFDPADADFLTAFAGLLGIAIERHQSDERLRDALEHQALLTREMSHRVKNSLGVVAGLLRLQARDSQSEEVRHALDDAGSRIATVAQVHDHLWRGNAVGIVELDVFLGELVGKLRETAPGHALLCHADKVAMAADQAIPLGLLVNELVTNAVKYAYPDGAGEIAVRVACDGDDLRVEVADRGIGLPAGFDLNAPRPSLGLKMIRNLARQLDGEVEARPHDPGAHFLFTMPLVAPPTP